MFTVRKCCESGEKRFVSFVTENGGLKYLTEINSGFMDSNFAIAPTIFQRLCVIKVEIYDVFVTTIIYDLPERKMLTTHGRNVQNCQKKSAKTLKCILVH